MLLTEIPNYFKKRRDALMEKFPQGIFLLPSNPEVIRNGDVHYPYRQESYFYYLTGFEEAHSFLVLFPFMDRSLSKKEASARYKMALFVQPSNPEKAMWEGDMYGLEGACKVFGADEVYPISDLSRVLPDLLAQASQYGSCEGDGGGENQDVFYHLGYRKEIDSIVLKALETHKLQMGRTGKGLQSIHDSWAVVAEQRLIKSPEEVFLMEKSCKISASAHREAMRQTQAGMNECEVEALVDASFKRQGCARVGYGSIVAGGKNAACLHYRWNRAPLNEGDLLLIDAGGEYEYYTADITRTFPVGKKFTQSQAQLYDLVLKAQKLAIGMVKPGVLLTEIHQKTIEWMAEGYLSLGLMEGSVESIIKNQEYRRFYPHGTSHWLGMDVHDVGLYQLNKKPRKLEAGMVFTIEPGFYVQPQDQLTPEKYRNIGIRIEDDILVTETGFQNLTEGAPKEREEIEALRHS